RSYLDAFDRISARTAVKGMAHITGGGIRDNLERVLPDGCSAAIRKGAWPVPKVFDFLRRAGGVDDEEMLQVFNMGLGMLVIIGAADESKVIDGLRGVEEIYPVGVIEKGDGAVTVS
ncbi:MAG: AIR synthase-related protein, partial [bacterium]